EEWAMPAKDRGKVKALARDYIDSRRLLISEYILFAVFVLLIAVFLLGRGKNSSVILLIELAILGVITVESTYHGAKVARLARQRFPGESTRGLTWYLAKRSIRIRSTRIPPPRVSKGQEI